MAKNFDSWECDKLFASEASGPQKNMKMGLGGNFTFCGYGHLSLSDLIMRLTTNNKNKINNCEEEIF